MTPLTLWTIGHSNRSFEEFADILQSGEIKLVVDVRRFPGSKKHPHFGQDQLPGLLKEHGIDYLHLPELGGRRPVLPDSPNTAWRNKSFQGYADHMASAEFRDGLDRLLAAAREQRVAFMCSEAVWWRCHRGLIADRLKADGHMVLHLMSKTKQQEHPYTSAASISDGELSYAP